MNPLRMLLLMLLVGGLKAESLTLVADPWCPYNCQPGSERPGFMVEIAQRVFATEGIAVRYRTLPWLRALQETERGRFDAAIGASRVEAPTLVFPELEQGQMSNAFWATPKTSWVYQGVASLARVRLAAIAGYGYGPEVSAYLEQPEGEVTLLYGSTPLTNGLQMLDRGRIDVLLEDEQVFRYRVVQQGRTQDFQLVGRVPLDRRYSDVFIAFSPRLENAEHYARLLSEGTARLRASGELAEILARYGVRDWRED